MPRKARADAPRAVIEGKRDGYGRAILRCLYEKPEIVDGIEEEQDVVDELPINGQEECDELIGSDITIKDPTIFIALLNDEYLDTEKGN